MNSQGSLQKITQYNLCPTPFPPPFPPVSGPSVFRIHSSQPCLRNTVLSNQIPAGLASSPTASLSQMLPSQKEMGPLSKVVPVKVQDIV